MLSFEPNPDAQPLELISLSGFDSWREQQSEVTQQWIATARFHALANQFVTLPDDKGNPSRIVVGIGEKQTIESIGSLPKLLPVGSYRLADPNLENLYELCLGWGLGAYQYKAALGYVKSRKISLHIPDTVSLVADEIDAINLARTLISKPANLMLPGDLEEAFCEVGAQYHANVQVTTGDELLEKGYRTIYTVGKASTTKPRLLDLTWGDPNARKITVLGKGVCFDSGGLDLKPAAGMRSMKKDMGGASIALGLTKLIMARNLPVRLRLLIPAVENAVAGNAYRPGDVIETYKGSRVEVGNTDAEGRLILCDALTLATEEKPELMIDFATLTGAARTAVGPDVSAMFCTDDKIAGELEQIGQNCLDPIARLPLHRGYRASLNSPVADLCNISSMNTAGAITAALFLQHFVGETPWIHFDINAWNERTRPARPSGGEAMALRATYRFLEDYTAT